MLVDFVAHHLRLMGLASIHLKPGDREGDHARVTLISRVGADDAASVQNRAAFGEVLLILLPRSEFVTAIGGACEPEKITAFSDCRPIRTNTRQWNACRSLHPATSFVHPCGEPLLTTSDGRAVWLKIPHGIGFILLVGSDIAGDLIRYRQGDPAQAQLRPTESLWGIAGERPNYLYETQIPAGGEHDRQADWWAMALAQAVADCLGEPLKPMLPGGVPGAIVITGDDDQAYLEKYQEQLALLNGLPITYFLHPLTRHTPKTLAKMVRHGHVELGLHPDALEHPNRYQASFQDQAAWFRELTGQRATLVRNHGYLNDGYWGHLPVWLKHGVKANANLPGVNGQVVNGSLLPARMVWNGQLTTHWSILTAIGDGVRFALGMDGPQSAQCIRDLAGRILDSRLPGVIVLNLHPQNIAETKDMHTVLHELVRGGFLPMTLGDCIEWFSTRDRGDLYVSKSPNVLGILARTAQIFGFRRGCFGGKIN